MEATNGTGKVQAFLDRVTRRRDALDLMRAMLLESGLTEELKWGKPAYQLDGATVALLYDFKDSAAMGFWKGVLLADPAGLLAAPGENSQSMRMARFADAAGVRAAEAALRALIADAIRVERAGLTVAFVKSTDQELPAELTERMEALPALRTAFEALTPGRRRGYAIYFAGAKQSRTRADRVEKCIPLILEGKGLND